MDRSKGCPWCRARGDSETSSRLPILDVEDLALESLEERRGWLRVFATSAAIPIDRPIVIGRGGGVDVALPSKLVSRRHALVFGDARTYRVADLGSRNGVYVNEERVASCELDEGDLLRIGRFVLAFTFREPGASSSAA